MLAQKLSTEPQSRVFTVENTARALQREIIRHNFRVAGIALLSLVVAAGLWGVLYVAGAWVLLVLHVAISGQPQAAWPHAFTAIFAVAAACSLAYAWLDHRLTLNALPRDNKSHWEIASDVLLTVPRLTLSIWGTLSAAQWLSSHECAEAAAFLHRLARERRIPMHQVPLDITDPEARFRILFALQLIEAIDLRRDERETTIRLNSSRPSSLGLPRS